MTLEKARHTRPGHPAMTTGTTQPHTITDIDGWETFSEDEKNFIALFLVMGRKGKAAQALGKDTSWHQARANKKFDSFIRKSDSKKAPAVAKHYAHEVVLRGLLECMNTINTGELPDKLKAMDFALKVANSYDKKLASAQTEINQTFNVLQPQKPSWMNKNEVIDA
tara:strand:- start:1137 stop:1634 length:498 start_codon:yes stop_codon:yes gene_type:complete